MQYTVTRGEKGKVEVKVDIPKVVFSQAYDEILQKLGKEVNIAGFRPGNVPSDVLEAKTGANKILNETASLLISKNLSQIFKKEDIVPLGNPSIAIQNLSKDSPFSFTATFITKPKVKLGDWKKIKVTKVKAREVTEKDVEESIKNIFEAWKKNRKSKSEAKSEGELEDQNQSKPSFAPSFAKATNDKRASEGKKFIYDAHGEKIFIKDEEQDKGKSSFAKVSEDEVDDNFAKAIGARDLVYLKEIVKKDLEQIMLDRVEAKLEQELFDELLMIVQVEVPDILVDDEINRIILRITQNLEGQGKKIEDYLREENTTLDALRAKLRPQAEKNVQITLAMDEIGKSEKVEVTSEEIENATKGVDESKLTDSQKADLRNYLAVSIFQAKALDHVKNEVAS
ncbi:hypothetical protein A3A49_01585 [Candidatus Curtissbacteria bacterium RIFCSPLOWO2_01_FULL_38_11b]|uniref:Trigger factor n=1 Tax=Candidatus Curtissbacteria bacterium RIFCSPLOWO2_01_FULL_38_11b TaxID=1797725 RepID=A0A1F5H1V2_9BACT|nr:MAG: hypothetical protein A3A49_01585 [Candidatus Curtissbacteria bacterium RIFCSPLOWO2_01_FULL_38_11b]